MPESERQLDGFGTQALLNNDYMARMASAVLGITEIQRRDVVPRLLRDADGQMLTKAGGLERPVETASAAAP
jgi:hypothetical protein